MPPRIALRSLQAVQAVQHQNRSLPCAFLLPFLNKSTRNASILSELSDTPGAYAHRIRRGRGPSSGKGKTSGRGHKGQGQHGKVPAGFTGGQTRQTIVDGHHGFTNIHADVMSPVNLDRIQDWIDQGRIDPSQPITLREIVKSRAIHGIKDGIKLLARGEEKLTTPINIIVSRASAAAIAAVEKVGGTVITRYYTKHAIRRILKGETDPYISMRWEADKLSLPVGMGADPATKVKGNGFQYRLPDPTGRRDLEYYRDPAKRGYLSHTIGEGENPSLFFKNRVASGKKKVKAKTAKVQSESLW